MKHSNASLAWEVQSFQARDTFGSLPAGRSDTALNGTDVRLKPATLSQPLWKNLTVDHYGEVINYLPIRSGPISSDWRQCAKRRRLA
jgi:hypothetical protein